MTKLGMDVDAVESAGRALKERAGHIDSIVGDLDRTVKSLAAVWDGKDAHTFVNQWWPEHRKLLVAARSHVDGLGQSALNNASEQRDASKSGGTGTGGGLTTPPQHDPGQTTPVLPQQNQPAAGAGDAHPPVNPSNYGAWANNLHNAGEWGMVDAAGKPPYECTSWASFRRHELDLSTPSGAGGDMSGNAGGLAGNPPQPGSLVSYDNHVMVIENVHGNSFTTSEMNYLGSHDVKMRTWVDQGNGVWKANEDNMTRTLIISAGQPT